MAPIIPVNAGRFCNGTENAIMINAPEKIPAEPIPAIERPMINAVDVGATPQTNEPSSKIKMAVR